MKSAIHWALLVASACGPAASPLEPHAGSAANGDRPANPSPLEPHAASATPANSSPLEPDAASATNADTPANPSPLEPDAASATNGDTVPRPSVTTAVAPPKISTSGAVTRRTPAWSCVGDLTWLAAPTEGAPPFGDHVHSSAWWSGEELFVWTSGKSAAYRPCAKRWRALRRPPNPLLAELDAAERFRQLGPAQPVRAGKLLLFYHWDIGGKPTEKGARAVALVYDIAADRWKAMSTKGMPSERIGMAITFTGRELLVWGGHSFAGTHHQDGALYDPRTDRWRAVAAPPQRFVFDLTDGRPDRARFAWTGSELVMHNGTDGWRFSPTSNRWLPIAKTGAPKPGKMPTVAWIGERLVVGTTDAAAYDPTTDGWSSVVRPGQASLVGAHWLVSGRPQTAVAVLDGEVRPLDPSWQWTMSPIEDRLGASRFIALTGGRAFGPTPTRTVAALVDLAQLQRTMLPALPFGGTFTTDRFQLHGDVAFFWGATSYTQGGSGGCDNHDPSTGIVCDPFVTYVGTQHNVGAFIRLP